MDRLALTTIFMSESERPLNARPLLREDHMRQTHQPDQATFRFILPDDINWQSFPAFPPSVRLAVLVGHPAEPGLYVIRVRAPGGEKVMPHKHPEDRVYTVISGVFYVGLGEEFDGNKVKAYPPGTVIVLPGDTFHFHWAKSGEYVVQVTAIGTLGLEYFFIRPTIHGEENSCTSIRSAAAHNSGRSTDEE
jgi:hypothetical protein